MMRKTIIALFAPVAVGLVQPTAASARGGGGGGHGGGSCAAPYFVRSSMLLAVSYAGTAKSRHRAGLVDGDGFSISRPCPQGQPDVPGK